MNVCMCSYYMSVCEYVYVCVLVGVCIHVCACRSVFCVRLRASVLDPCLCVCVYFCGCVCVFMCIFSASKQVRECAVNMAAFGALPE